jgi:hypothetical protein
MAKAKTTTPAPRTRKAAPARPRPVRKPADVSFEFGANVPRRRRGGSFGS